MKKLVSFILVCVISCSLVLTGCGDDTSQETTNKIGKFDKTRVITDKGVFYNNENTGAGMGNCPPEIIKMIKIIY